MSKEFDTVFEAVITQAEVLATQEIKSLDDLSLAYIGGGEALVNM
jgi:hypothetical protein